jgi:hypothetical protein
MAALFPVNPPSSIERLRQVLVPGLAIAGQDQLPVLQIMKQDLSAALSFSVAGFPTLAAYSASTVQSDLRTEETDQLRVQLGFGPTCSRCWFD